MLDLEHKTLKSLKKYSSQLSGREWFVAVSGGLDSMALLGVLMQLHKGFQATLKVYHYHHGDQGTVEQQQYRNEAWNFVQDFCSNHQLPFFSNKSSIEKVSSLESSPGLSEQKLREGRYQYFEIHGSGLLFLAHHREDLLETRLIRLIRGTGVQGLPAMQELQGSKVRPFLLVSQKSLQDYAIEKGLSWLNDPSNESLDPMRNWLRHHWLPQLEDFRPGAVDSLSRSLQVLSEVEAGGDKPHKGSFLEGLDRALYYTLSESEKSQRLAQYVYHLGIKNYSRGQIQELMKRLDNSQKRLNFSLLYCDWQVDTKWIKASPKATSKGES